MQWYRFSQNDTQILRSEYLLIQVSLPKTFSQKNKHLRIQQSGISPDTSTGIGASIILTKIGCDKVGWSEASNTGAENESHSSPDQRTLIEMLRAKEKRGRKKCTSSREESSLERMIGKRHSKMLGTFTRIGRRLELVQQEPTHKDRYWTWAIIFFCNYNISPLRGVIWQLGFLFVSSGFIVSS